MHFQIYFPGMPNEQHSPLEAIQRGLSAGALCHPILDGGPDGGPGCAFWWGPGGYVPGKLTWIPSIEREGSPAGAYMIGYDPQALPTPDELQWGNRFDGYWVELGDKQKWLIPAAGMLPRVRKLKTDGRPGLIVREEFDWYWRESAAWYDLYVNADLNAMNLSLDGSCWDYAIRALGINYRMPPEIPLILGLFDTSNIIRAIGATIQELDMDEVADLIKKKDTASS